ncbi:MAG: HEAT repeat domain-containing protein, partial [Planctomycetes bacterium]|nr:HEAT repeat domain-containing protein [Planctomycetota bacterium]
QPGLAQPADFEIWTQRLASAALEPGEVAFAVAGARAAAGPIFGTAQVRKLVEALLAGQPAQAQSHLPALVAEGGPELVLVLAADSRAPARAASAAGLAGLEHPDALETLRRLTLDRDEAVAAAALHAIGARRATLLRGAVRTRCMAEQEPSALVRAAALRALGALGLPPDGTLEEPGSLALFLRAFGDADPRIEEAAADGLAAYGDPAAAPVLMSLLSRPEGSALELAGRTGLARLGVAAWDDLLRISKSSTHPLRRSALLILARQGCAQACRYLLEYYTDHASDSEIAFELCVLTCHDLRAAPDPVQAWWDWWDAAPRDDGRAWWIAGAARAGFAAPPEGALDAPVGAAGRAWIEQQLERGPEHLAERARRALALYGLDTP